MEPRLAIMQVSNAGSEGRSDKKHTPFTHISRDRPIGLEMEAHQSRERTGFQNPFQRSNFERASIEMVSSVRHDGGFKR